MKESNADNLCSHGGDVLAYLYNEMQSVDRDTFEAHLADCGTCIDDFAELSQSRYPVFEWKQLEFDPLPTPRFVIPVASVSWFDKLRASFALRPAFAFGSLATIAIVASVAAFILMGGTTGTNEIANVEPVATPNLPAPSRLIDEPEKPDEVAIDDPKVELPRREEPRVVNTSAPKPAVRPIRPKTTQQARRTEKLPTLNATEEEEDDSLRLADIFDEIGG